MDAPPFDDRIPGNDGLVGKIILHPFASRQERKNCRCLAPASGAQRVAATMTGTLLSAVLPLPSWPEPLLPQQ